MNARHIILLLSIALLASIGGALAYRFVFTQELSQGQQAFASAPAEIAPDLIGMRRPDYTLGSGSGERISADDFNGRVVLVNFWATWCKPCREEMPMLVDLQQAFDGQEFQVVGIALDDVQQARDFAAELGVDYPILVGSTDVMAVVRLYGNLSGVLPYSVLVDRAGIIRWAHLGALKDEELQRQIGELLPGNTVLSGSENSIPKR
jgi:thiol-disulfide isomerase/thioredoxin